MPPGTPLPEALKQLLASNQSVYQVSAAASRRSCRLVRAPLGPAAVGMVLALVVGLGGLFLVTTPVVPAGAPRSCRSATRGWPNR